MPIGRSRLTIISLLILSLVLVFVIINLVPIPKFNDYNEFNDIEVYGEQDEYPDFVIPMAGNESNETRTIRFPILYRILSWRIERLEKLREFCLVDE